ncbi:MAG: LacI family transcriptional regulator [Thermotogae bacterium]|nr:MAG: LacI family transcriptional regulator [Thermotogota bacterium]
MAKRFSGEWWENVYQEFHEPALRRETLAKKRATLRMIAEYAGVSIATVSRVLNNSRRVNPEIARRVIEIANRLSYRPNEVARGLVKGKIKTFGIVVPDIDNPFFSKICKAIQNTVRKEGYSVFLYNTDGKPEREKEIIENLVQRLIEGIFMIAPRMNPKEILELSKEYGFYPIIVDSRVENVMLSAVWVDNVTAFIRATEHLIETGHRRIGFVAGSLNVANSRDRLKGYLLALENNGIEKDDSLIYEGDFMISSGYKAAEYLLSLENPPTAILCSNDLMAIGVLRYLHDKGIKVPEQISVVGCDDIDVTASLYPPLTTVKQPIYEMGEIAAKMMLKYIKTGKLPPNSILHADLVIRDSTAPKLSEVR